MKSPRTCQSWKPLGARKSTIGRDKKTTKPPSETFGDGVLSFLLISLVDHRNLKSSFKRLWEELCRVKLSNKLEVKHPRVIDIMLLLFLLLLLLLWWSSSSFCSPHRLWLVFPFLDLDSMMSMRSLWRSDSKREKNFEQLKKWTDARMLVMPWYPEFF